MTEHKPPHESAPARRKGFLLPLIGLGAAAAVAAFAYYRYSETRESTDDAFIDAHVVSVSPQIAGHVLKVLTDDNQAVKTGDLLVEIDPADYEAALDKARAQTAETAAEERRAVLDAERNKDLLARAEISRQHYDDVLAAQQSAEAALAAARAAERISELNLSYTRLLAPADGRVTRKAVEPGQYVQVGQPLMSLVPAKVWVTANFKETQLARIRPGQSAEITVDAYPGRVFRGHVDSIQSGSGARFSLLPPENATGNFVKVVQRVPVKILIDDQDPEVLLAPGMSAVPIIKVR